MTIKSGVEITGQVILRDAGSAEAMLPGENKKLLIVFGIIAVPNETTLEGEHQYVLTGLDSLESANIMIHKRLNIDRGEVTAGESPTGILKQPIWKV